MRDGAGGCQLQRQMASRWQRVLHLMQFNNYTPRESAAQSQVRAAGWVGGLTLMTQAITPSVPTWVIRVVAVGRRKCKVLQRIESADLYWSGSWPAGFRSLSSFTQSCDVTKAHKPLP